MLPAHRFAETNGIRMHYAQQGSGPLVLLLHGFPELWYAWRHQFEPLVAAGYRVVAPDLRGYGQTSCPEPLEAYDIFQLTGDIVGLVHALGESTAVIVGHDWGAWIAAHLALLRQDMFRALALLSVPYVPRRPVNQTQWEQQAYPGKVFYQAGLRSPMVDQYLKYDVRASILRGLYSLSAEAGPEERFQPVREPGPPSSPPPAKCPSWITEEDVDVFAGEFQRTGFTGGLNYYRNMDRNWALTPFLDGAKILQPALFIAGEQDPVLEFLRPEYDALEENVPNLTKKVLLPGAGHWTQQERPNEVNRLLLEFLAGL
ncbi:alpha/beta fold hydrolase [Paludibaculum fermentans]|uniref:alpha/beta fold hydrolase n=1 Tax=Paludibaculum fermentans TaxID=1473598 RepID=UPI003EC06DC1